MRSIGTVCILLSALFLASACGSATSESASEGSRLNRATNTGPPVSSAAKPAPEAVPASPQGNSAEPTANTALAGSPQDVRGLKRNLLRGPTGLQNSEAQPPVPEWRPAPDNSVYSVVLTDAAVETRIFKNHPQLLRVEKRSDGKQRSIKVFLKDGRVIDLPGEKIEALGTAPAPAILEAAGLDSSATGGQRQTKKKSTDINPR